jgi:hypothetical protein
MTDAEAWILKLLRTMTGDKGRYGTLVIKVQAGEIVHANETVDHKPPIKPGGRRILG